MRALYARDLHPCERCGCVIVEKALKKGRRIDDILKLDEVTWVCLDEKRCARLKVERDDTLTAEREIHEAVGRRIREAQDRLERKGGRR